MRKSSLHSVRWFWDFARSVGKISIIDLTRNLARAPGAIPFVDWAFELCHASGAISAVRRAWEFPNADSAISVFDLTWSLARAPGAISVFDRTWSLAWAAIKVRVVNWACCWFFDAQAQHRRALSSRAYPTLDALPVGLNRGGCRRRSGAAGSPVGPWKRAI